VDLAKRDAEIKLLLGCASEEMATVLAFHRRGDQQAILLMPS
jgi:inorganic pyrophosphatase